MKRLFLFALAMLLALAPSFASAQRVTPHIVLSGATTAAAGPTIDGIGATKTFQASGTTSSGTGSATIAIQCSNDASNWSTLGTITLTLSTSSTSDSFTSDDRCVKMRANVTALSGTGASVSVTAGY